jgi:tetratricopeptide (TPR) repeat protein
MSRYLILFAVLSLSHSLYGQNMTFVKKLRRELPNASDQQAFLILNDLAWEYRVASPDSGIYFAQSALAIGQKLKRDDLARSMNMIGLCHYHKGDNLVAYEYFSLALKTAEANADLTNFGHANNNLGRLFMEQGVRLKAQAHLVTAMNTFKSINDSSGLAYSLQGLAGYYKSVNDLATSEKHYLDAYAIRLALGNTREIAVAQTQLGKLHMTQQNYALAMKYFLKGDSTANIIGDKIVLAECKINLAQSLIANGDLAKAEVIAGEVLDYIQQSQNMRILPEANLTMGQIYHKRGDLEKAKYYFTETIAASRSRRDLNTRLEAYFFLWQADKQRQQRANEFKNYSAYMSLKDSIRTLEAAQREAQLNFHLEIERKEAENEILKVREQRKTAIIVILVLLVISAAIILYLLVKTKKRILRVNHLLEDRNGQIKKMNHVLEGRNVKLEDHMSTLVQFSKNRSISIGNLSRAAKDIVSITANKLNTSQVSIWIYQEENMSIRTIACYNREKDQYLEPAVLFFDDAPTYFDAVKKQHTIIADDARNHPLTKEFNENYFIPNNIYSLLDVTFFLDGKLKGLLCCEHQHELRTWTAEDKLFVRSVADIITLSFRTAQRLEYEKYIKEQNRQIASMNQDLEERVQQRTQELEAQNKKLAEYAFINSHLLRGPLSRILGLINVIDQEHNPKETELISLLRRSGNELDEIVKKITETLNEGEYLSVEELRKTAVNAIDPKKTN